MPTDPRHTGTGPRHLMTFVRSRMVDVHQNDRESGALSLEWVAIAIVLVATALALAVFLGGKLGALEALIPS